MTSATQASATALPLDSFPPQPSLYRLLSIYWDRYEALTHAMTVTDATAAGTKERGQAEQAQAERGNEVDAAGVAICAFIPRWSMDAKIKSHFVDTLADFNCGTLTEPETTALLSTLPFVCRAK